MGAYLAHCGPAKANLAVAAGQLPGDRREQEPATDGRCGDASHGHPVDGTLCLDAVADPGDGPVLHEAAQECGVRLAACVTEIELERVAVQGGRGQQVREAGAEDSRSAERHDRQHSPEQGSAHRDGGPAVLALQGLTDTDHRARRCAHRGEASHHGRGTGHFRLVAGPHGTCGPHGRPDAQGEHSHHHGERSERKDAQVERHAGGGLGKARLAHRSERGQRGSQRDGAGRAGQRHRQAPRHAERDELPPVGAQGRQRGIVAALDDALPGHCLADDRQPHDSGEGGQDPPPDGLRTDGCLDGCDLLAAVLVALHAGRVEGIGLSVESGQASRTAAQPDEVLIAVRRPRDHGPRERPAGEQVVHRRRPGRELTDGGLDPDHVERNRRTGGPRWCAGGAVRRRQLRSRVERHADNCAEMHPFVLLQSEGRQHLVGVRRVRQAARDQLPHRPGAGRYDAHLQVRRVDRMGAGARRLTLKGAYLRRDGSDPGSPATFGTGRTANTAASKP